MISVIFTRLPCALFNLTAKTEFQDLGVLFCFRRFIVLRLNVVCSIQLEKSGCFWILLPYFKELVKFCHTFPMNFHGAAASSKLDSLLP